MKKNIVTVVIISLVCISLVAGAIVLYLIRSSGNNRDNSNNQSITNNQDIPDNQNGQDIIDTQNGQDSENGGENSVDEQNGTEQGQIDSGNNDTDQNNTGKNNNSGIIDVNNYTAPYSNVKKPDAVKALYLTGWTAGTSSALEKFIQITNETEINSVVIDIKDDDGVVGYESNIPAVREINAWKYKYNVDKVIKTLHDNGIYVIGRLVCFKDPVLSTKRPDLAVKNTSGGLWKDNSGTTWLDPYNRESWSYIIDIAKEAIEKGFDEIQFDYVRFPNDGNKKAMSFNSQGEKKYEAINEFLAYARENLPGVILSADVFGIICESPEDTEDIGQYLELVGKDIEYISPMVYPSHYAFNQIVNNVQFPKPDLEPYAVVYNSLVKAKERISKVPDYKANIRPYLQGFTASWLKQGNYQVYGAKQIREQIQAVYDAGLKEWIIWDPSNKYPVEAFEKEN